ncbi:DUF6482 family protein [Pseudomonas sp. R5(2019)]|uniref:DUF6482 family protein n=1 Tax=Pseudomonas sp. R5(2019) TaxID=2697566 RepID=UPI0014121082|nr:DUF6482 family protein [Pseudomonas sp. R5(2019)]NBA96456.1 cation transporter [Pseudomonas sp. R5(2019)]
MNLHDLNTQAKAGHVEELNLIAIEGGDYLIEARVHGRAHPLSDAKGQRVRVHSVIEARAWLQRVPDLPLNLVHWSIQDEMCGMSSANEEDLKLPISRR